VTKLMNPWPSAAGGLDPRRFQQGPKAANAAGAASPTSLPWKPSLLLRGLFRSEWVVYAKRPFGGAEHALRYLGCYTHRVAISNHRLVALENGEVVFRWRDSAHKNKKRLMRLPLDEFLRRFFLHVLPRGFVRIRHFGFFAHRRRAALLPVCFALLGKTADLATVPDSTPTDAPRPLWLCPQCGGTMAIVERVTAAEARLRSPRRKPSDYDLLFLMSNLSRAGTPAGENCPLLVDSHWSSIAAFSNCGFLSS
jgi:hypothetical protein